MIESGEIDKIPSIRSDTYILAYIHMTEQKYNKGTFFVPDFRRKIGKTFVITLKGFSCEEIFIVLCKLFTLKAPRCDHEERNET